MRGALIAAVLTFVNYAGYLYAQPPSTDSSHIVTFSRQNIVEIFPGVYGTSFSFSNPLKKRDDFRLTANSSYYTGIYLNYKWFTAKYSWAIPHTQIDKNIRLRYADLQFRWNLDKLSIHPFYESYNGLLLQRHRHVRKYEPLRDIRYTEAGTDLVYFLNSKQKFSYKVANFFSGTTKKSMGSLLLSFSPKWERLQLRKESDFNFGDSLTYHLLLTNPQWMSLVIGCGYNHCFSLQKGKYLISPAFTMGPGLLREINRQQGVLQPVYKLQGWLTAGYNGPVFYSYFSASWDYTQTHLLVKSLNKSTTDISLTVGFRFCSAPGKILKIL